MILRWVFVISMALVYTAKGQTTLSEVAQCCDVTTSTSCVNETSSQVCIPGSESPNGLVPTGNAVNCPDGTVCDQHEESVCVPSAAASAPGIPDECLLLLTTMTQAEDSSTTTETTISSTEESTITTEELTTTTEEPTTTTQQPTSTTEVPTITTEQSTTEELTTTTEQPSTTTEELTTTTEQPSTTTEELTTTTEQPSTMTEELTTITEQPTTTTEEPTTTTTEQPTTTTEEPTTTTTEQPITTTESSTTTTEQSTTEEPTTPTEQPTTTAEEPTTTTEQSTTEELTTTTVQPSTTTEPITTPTTPPADHFTCTSTGVFSDPNNCSVFYTCPPNPEGGWFQVTFTCPTGYEFSVGAKHCVTPEEANCSVSSNTPPTNVTFTCTSPGRFPNPVNCTSFYMCSPNPSGGYFEIPARCPEGYAFDGTLKRCTTLEEAGCDTFVTTTTTTSTTTTTTQAPATTTRTTPTTTTTTQSPPTTEFQCTESGKFPHPSNCSLYYGCSPNPTGGYYRITFTCPSGFAYNISLQRCDSAANVRCPRFFHQNAYNIPKQSTIGYIKQKLSLSEWWLKLQEGLSKLYRWLFRK